MALSAMVEFARVKAVGTLYNTFTTAKSILTSATATGASAGAQPIWPGAFTIGSTLGVKMLCSMSWASGNTMIFSIMCGSIAVATSATLKVTTTGGTTEPLYFDLLFTCQTEGTGTLAKLVGGGIVAGRGICPAGATAGANYAAGMGLAMWQEATVAQGTGFDSTVQNTFDVQCTMGTSSASNGIRIEELSAAFRGLTGP